MFLAVHQSNTPLVLQHTVSAPQRVEPERVEDASLREHQHRHLVGVGSGRAQRGHGAGERARRRGFGELSIPRVLAGRKRGLPEASVPGDDDDVIPASPPGSPLCGF